MSRVRKGTKGRARRAKILKLAKGFHFDRRRKIRHAKPTVERALAYRYIGRKLLKRDMRSLWIQRINAASRLNGISYSQFMNGLSKKNIQINRKMLADIAVRDAASFKNLVEFIK